MFSLIATACIVSIIVILGIFTFLSNPSNQTNRYYALSTGFLALWMVVNFLGNEPSLVGFDALHIFLRLDFALAITYFFVWFAFCYSFTLKPFPALERYKIFFILTLSTLLLSLLSIFTDTILTNTHFDELIQFTNGPLWGVYAFHMLATASGGLVLLYFGKKNAKKQNNKILIHQINIVFLGFFIAIGNGLVINLLLQPFIPISLEVSRFGIFGMSIFVALTSYAIAKYHFFDIKLAVIRTFSFFSLSVAVIILYVYILTIGMSYLFAKDLEADFLFMSVMLTTFVALSFHPLQQKIAELTKHFFYKGYYNSQELLAELTHIMASNINIDVMTKSLLLTLKSTLQVTGAAFIVYKKDGTFDLKTSATDSGDHCLDFYGAEKINAVYRESTPCPPGTKICRFQDIQEESAKELFRELRIGLIIPIKTSGVFTALLILGEKKSGEVYSPQDLEFLGIFGDEVGIAIQNAQAYREIAEFTTVLEARVTERTTQLEEAQASELQKAVDVAKLRDEFVFIATHELRAPITAIRLFLEIVSADTENVPLTLKSHLDSIHKASEHLNQLIDDLLEIARSESGPASLPVTPVQVVEVTQQVVHELQALADARNISITYANENKPHMVLAHKDKLKEVITNLISNAIKYNKEHGTITITFVEGDGTITTEVRDTGYGIPLKHHQGIFNKFYRAMKKETEEVVGTGLGLFISRMLLEKMGGTIQFSSVENEESTFAFTLKSTHTKTDA